MLRIIGHRGARGLAPENTLASINKALQHGVDEIEVDIRVSKDGVVFLHHDIFLSDQAGNKLMIWNYNYAELLKHKPDLTTLEDAVRVVGRKVPLQLEVKWGERTAPIIAVLRKLLAEGWQPADFMFGSKKQRTLLELHRALPAVPTVVIEPFLSVRGHLRARQVGTKRISMNHLGLWPGFIRAMRRRDYCLYTYSLNDPAKAARWHGHGLAGVITDLPDRFEEQSS